MGDFGDRTLIAWFTASRSAIELKPQNPLIVPANLKMGQGHLHYFYAKRV
jgi:hypothetical protein